MFAEFVIEREYASLSGLKDALVYWLQVLGVLSLAVMVIWELARLALRRGSSFTHGLGGTLQLVPADQVWKRRSYGALVIAAVSALILAGVVEVFGRPEGQPPSPWGQRLFLVACVAAVLAVSWEFLLDLFSMSPRRVWAVARLSMMEAIRGKALWGFGILLLVFLFASWFVPVKRPENQWRLYVDLVFKVMLGLMVVISSVLAAFSLPTDIRRQTIHTIVTKPVLRMEVLAGRILGIGVLMTLVLLVASHLSLLYVFREIDETARRQTVRARLYTLGDLKFEMLTPAGTWEQKEKGEDVGRVFDYRSHIRGGDAHEGVWRFRNLPARFQDPQWRKANPSILVEFTFDIMRMSRDREERGGGVFVFIKFINSNRWKGTGEEYLRYRDAKDPVKNPGITAEQLAEEFGYAELDSPMEVLDYRTHTVQFPSGVLKDLGERGELEIRVQCRSHGQYLGMARHDLYLVTAEGSFYLNYLKGVLGIWAVTMMVIALATVFSTQLNGLISLMFTWLLLFLGLPRVRGFLHELALPRTAERGNIGPVESAYRLFRGVGLTAGLEEGTALLLERIDRGFRLLFTGVVNVLPDLHQYDRTMHVAEGFGIPGTEIGMSVILLAGYLVPFFLAGYYLFHGREVAA